MIDSIVKMNMKDQFKECAEKCKQAMNRDLDYEKAYDLAVQAKYIAQTILEDPLSIFESELLRGLSRLGMDRMSGHEILNKLYCESRSLIKGKIYFETLMTYAMGTAKKCIGEYDEALIFFHDCLKLSQKQIEQANEDGKNPLSNISRVIRVTANIVVALLYKSRQINYPLIINSYENKVKQIGYDNLERIKEELNKVTFSIETNNELKEAERFINEALRLAKEYQLKEMELMCLLNKANILIEKEDYFDSIKILEFLENEEYIAENVLGYVLNEKGIAYINIGKLELGVEVLHKSWNWLSKKKDLDGLSRNLYGTSLYYHKIGKLSMAYSFAEMALNRDNDLCSLKLLYEITLLKYIQVRRHGNESEYAFYRSEHEKYRNQLERRG